MLQQSKKKISDVLSRPTQLAGRKWEEVSNKEQLEISQKIVDIISPKLSDKSKTKIQKQKYFLLWKLFFRPGKT